MFSGIIKSLGSVNISNSATKLNISSPLFAKELPPLGASIAIDGVCLTVSGYGSEPDAVTFDLGQETLAKTRFKNVKPQSLVNIEPALKAGEPLDGHVVQGHVDGVAQIVACEQVESNLLIRFKAPPKLRHLIVTKGSIAIDGVSLTVNDISDETFSVCLVPYTLEHTSLNDKKVGDLVHLETDILGRYVAHMLKFDSENFELRT